VICPFPTPLLLLGAEAGVGLPSMRLQCCHSLSRILRHLKPRRAGMKSCDGLGGDRGTNKLLKARWLRQQWRRTLHLFIDGRSQSLCGQVNASHTVRNLIAFSRCTGFS